MKKAESRSVPVTILTGFLGSGKSSLINRMLKELPQLKFGLVVNEFGEASLESQLIHSRKEPLFELPSGCLCCVGESDLKKALAQITTLDPRVGHILVEASGLSSPGPLMQILTEEKAPGATLSFHLSGVLCVIDASSFLEREKDFPLIRRQLSFGDAVLLTKTDLVPNETETLVAERLGQLRPGLRILKTDAALPWNILLDAPAVDKSILGDDPSEAAPRGRRFFNSGTHHDTQVFEYESFSPLDPEGLREVFDGLDPGILRAKGYLRLAGKMGRWKYLVQYTGTQKQLYSRGWDKSEKPRTALLFLGKSFDADALKKALQACERPEGKAS